MDLKQDFQKAGEARLSAINKKIEDYSELSMTERIFLYGVVSICKPEKVLEVGVSSGASSAIILDAIGSNDNAHLFSVDLSKKYYRDGANWADLPEHKKRDVGFVVDQEFESLKDKWTLFTGGTAASFMEDIGGGIDLVFLDAAHGLPGEILDFLVTLPYVKKDAIYILHDINLQILLLPKLTAPRLLMNTVRAEKFHPHLTEHIIYNIGAFQISAETRKHVEDIFNSLLLDWVLPLSEEDATITRDLLIKHYDQRLVEIYNIALDYNLHISHQVVPVTGMAGRVSNYLKTSSQNIKNKHPRISYILLAPLFFLLRAARRLFS